MSTPSGSKIAQLLAVAVTSSLALVATGCSTKAEAEKLQAMAAVTGGRAAQVERGQYLVTVGGCNDCHTPWKMGPERARARRDAHALGAPAGPRHRPAGVGRGAVGMTAAATNTAWSGAWGVSFTANLTPDDEHRHRRLDRGHLHQDHADRPPLGPVTADPAADAVVQLRQDDRRGPRAIFAYLQSIPPIQNRVPEPLPPPAAPAVAGAI